MCGTADPRCVRTRAQRTAIAQAGSNALIRSASEADGPREVVRRAVAPVHMQLGDGMLRRRRNGEAKW